MAVGSYLCVGLPADRQLATSHKRTKALLMTCHTRRWPQADGWCPASGGDRGLAAESSGTRSRTEARGSSGDCDSSLAECSSEAAFSGEWGNLLALRVFEPRILIWDRIYEPLPRHQKLNAYVYDSIADLPTTPPRRPGFAAMYIILLFASQSPTFLAM